MRNSTKIAALRAAVFVFVIANPVLVHVYGAAQIGYSAQWEGGEGRVGAGSHPVLIAWSVVALLVYVAVILIDMPIEATAAAKMGRRSLAFAIDLYFSLLTVSSLVGFLSLGMEAARTGHFAWHFQREYAVRTDQLFGFPIVLGSMGLIFLYFVVPLLYGKQTVGCFLM